MAYMPDVPDEALTPSGEPRPGYERLLAQLADADLERLSGAVREILREREVTFQAEGGSREFLLDPVPRVIEPGEWLDLARGMSQRARAIDAFIADAYGERTIFAAGRVPERVIETADRYEPDLAGIEVAGGHAPAIGFDIVRGADGSFGVLEENLRTPSGFAYAVAAREAIDDATGLDAPSNRLGARHGYEALIGAIRAADPGGGAEGATVLLTDGPSNSAWWEHRRIAEELGIPVVTPGDLAVRSGRLHADGVEGVSEVRVVYRRTDEDRVRDERGKPTALAEVLLEPARRGNLTVVNALGAGIGDDKLTHAYVEEMIRFYLGEEPLLRGVRTYDLADEEAREEVLGDLRSYVVKPRAGYGGEGVVIGRSASDDELQKVAREVRRAPGDFVAQDTVEISTHPTVCDGRLEPRRIDLRAFAIGEEVSTGALTRVALRKGSMVVNSSRDGGVKDTWVLG